MKRDIVLIQNINEVRFTYCSYTLEIVHSSLLIILLLPCSSTAQFCNQICSHFCSHFCDRKWNLTRTKNCTRWFVLADAKFPFTITISFNQLNSLYNNIDKLCFKYGKHSKFNSIAVELTCICNSSKSKLYLCIIHIVISKLDLSPNTIHYI